MVPSPFERHNQKHKGADTSGKTSEGYRTGSIAAVNATLKHALLETQCTDIARILTADSDHGDGGVVVVLGGDELAFGIVPRLAYATRLRLDGGRARGIFPFTI